MSKTVRIGQDGVPSTYNGVQRLLTQVQAGAAQWMPEDDTMIGEIEVTENGEYVPYNDGLFGYSKVVVNVAGGEGAEGVDATTGEAAFVKPYPASTGGCIVGTDPDTGEIVMVSVVDVSGTPTLQTVTITEESLYPASISVLIPPRKLGYSSGQTIDYTGMTVVALDTRGYLVIDTEAFTSGGTTYGPYVGGLIPEKELALPKYANSTTVTVSWTSPYDGQTFTDSFEITIS